MDTILYAFILIINFLINDGLQRNVLVMGSVRQFRGNHQCLEYNFLKDETSTTFMSVIGTSMQYFPEGNCNNAIPEEELRVLQLPEMESLYLLDNKLLKVPNISGMSNLQTFHMQQSLVQTIPGKPFVNNKLLNIVLVSNKLIVAPDLDGARGTLTYFSIAHNQLTSLPNNYFDGCTKLDQVNLNGNLLKSFPNFAPIGLSLTTIELQDNHVNETIRKDAIAMLQNLRTLYLMNNQMPAFVLSFCNLTQELYCKADNNSFTRVENPYRDCIASVNTLPKPIMILTRNRLLSCDEKICWMKQYGFGTKNVNLGVCPDGREWNHVTKEELCQGKVQLDKISSLRKRTTIEYCYFRNDKCILPVIRHGIFGIENVNLGVCPYGREWKYITKEELCTGKCQVR